MERGLISVDSWKEESQAYFLTHLHADHTRGLSSKWKKGYLFCSPISAKLIPIKFPGFDVSLVRALEVGHTHLIQLTSLKSGSNVKVQVTPIDAQHCPGAVMYLFHGEFGCMLYTGDFRWEARSERTKLGKAILHGSLCGRKVDSLYLDNTYCNPSFSFPPREVAAQQVADLIASHPDHDIIIGIDTLGKEDLLLYVSQALRIKIWVWPERLQTMHTLGFKNVFTTQTCLTRVRAVPRYSFTIDTLEALNTIRPTLGILPSGLPWAMNQVSEKDPSPGYSISIDRCKESSSIPLQRFHKYGYSVLYSDHSCFNEIHEFVKFVKPNRIKGIVTKSFCYINPVHYFGHLCMSTHIPDELCEKSRHEQHEVKDIQPKCSHLKLIKPKSRKNAILGFLRDRHRILNRGKHGAAKIAQTDEIYGFDSNS